MPTNYNLAGYYAGTIAATANTILALADGGAITKPALAKSFVGYLETAQIRARGDGTAPTTTEGVVINIGDRIIMSEGELAAMRFIRTGATSGVIKGHFYTIEPNGLPV